MRIELNHGPRKQRSLWVVVATTLLFAGALSAFAEAPVVREVAAQPRLAPASAADDVVYVTNQQRLANGLLPLKRVSELDASGTTHANDMATHDFFSHTGSDGSRVGDRVGVAGYFNWAIVAENIAAGQPSAEAVVAAWMASPAHRAVILRNDLREIGVGYVFQANDQPNVVLPGGALGGPYYHYWVQNFGARYDVYPVIIDAEALATENQDVQLSVYGSEWATQMMVANTADFAGATWQAYQSTLTWTLAAGSGQRSVYVRLRDAYGNTQDNQDDIRLDAGAAPTATPTATTLPPTATPTAAPTNTPTPTDAPTPTDTPTPDVTYLQGSAFYDANQNGLHDSNEVFGLPGTLVILKNQDGQVVSTTTTDDSGAYQFALTALAGGNYAIKTVPQTSVIPTSQNPTYVYVVSGQWVDEVDFGFVSGSGPMITDMAAGPQPETAIVVTWTTQGESGNELYQVQRADQLRGVYLTVATVAGHGDGVYAVMDETVQGNVRYWYRLLVSPSNRLAGPVDAMLISSDGFRVSLPLLLH
ncbi:MAG: CAP domain-containing protein [Anaerolineae bacterium]